MKKHYKSILIFSGLTSLGIVCFIFYGLWLLEIEDRYGDLQTIYFEGKTGDLIFNKKNGKVGILKFENREILVVDNTKTFQLMEWLNSNQQFINLEVYRAKNPELFLNLTPQKFKETIKINKAEFIIHLNLNY